MCSRHKSSKNSYLSLNKVILQLFVVFFFQYVPKSETESDKGIEPPFQGITQSRIPTKVNYVLLQKITAMTVEEEWKLTLQFKKKISFHLVMSLVSPADLKSQRGRKKCEAKWWHGEAVWTIRMS